MQLVITALAPIRRDVGDVLAAVRPSGVVTLRAEQDQKFLTVSCAAHTLVDHAHESKLPALAPVSRVVFRVGHSTRLPLLIFLEFRQPQSFADLVVADTQRLNLRIRHMYFFTGFKIDAVDDTVGMNVFTVGMRTDQYLAALEISGKPAGRFVGCAWVNVHAAWEALHHVVELDATVLVVQQLRTQKFVERCFRLTADSADELLTIPERLARLRHISHDTFHAAACLCAFFVIHEMDDCDFPRPPSCICRRVTLIFANSCAAVSRLANCTLPMFASTAS